MVQRYGKVYALNERNVTLFTDDFLAVVKLLVSGFSGLLAIIAIGVLSNLDKLGDAHFAVKLSLSIYCFLLLANILLLSGSILHILLLRTLNNQIIEIEAAGAAAGPNLLKLYGEDILKLRGFGALSMISSLLCVAILPIFISVALFA